MSRLIKDLHLEMNPELLVRTDKARENLVLIKDADLVEQVDLHILCVLLHKLIVVLGQGVQLDGLEHPGGVLD